MPDEDLPPDMRLNVLKQRMSGAARRAEAAPGFLTASGGPALGSALSALESAWVSPSDERTAFGESLGGMGSAVTGVFGSHASLCRSEAGVEPEEVDPADADQGWKADGDRISARMVAPTGPRGY